MVHLKLNNTLNRDRERRYILSLGLSCQGYGNYKRSRKTEIPILVKIYKVCIPYVNSNYNITVVTIKFEIIDPQVLNRVFRTICYYYFESNDVGSKRH